MSILISHNIDTQPPTQTHNTEHRCWEKAIWPYLSELVGHKEGRSVGFGLHVGHMGGRRGVDVVAGKHLQGATGGGISFHIHATVSAEAAMQML